MLRLLLFYGEWRRTWRPHPWLENSGSFAIQVPVLLPCDWQSNNTVGLPKVSFVELMQRLWRGLLTVLAHEGGHEHRRFADLKKQIVRIKWPILCLGNDADLIDKLTCGRLHVAGELIARHDGHFGSPCQ
jgi:hypothetical protein